MKKYFYLLLLAGISVLFVSSPVYSAETSLVGKKIIIDAGHGGRDPGSTECPGITESTANLQIAYLLKGMIDGDYGEGFLLRTDDYYMDNADRYNLANSEGGDVLVSIHLNGSLDHTINYTQGLYAKYSKDYLFTGVVHDRLARELFPVPDWEVRQFADGVVLKSDMPATLQESVFISNTEECAMLSDGTQDRQEEIARALYLGLIDWFDNPQEFVPGKRK